MIKDNLFYLIYQMGNNVGYFDINLRSLHISCQMFDSEGDTVEDRETADYLCRFPSILHLLLHKDESAV